MIHISRITVTRYSRVFQNSTEALTITSHIDFLYLVLTQNLEKHELLLISARKEVYI